MQKTHHRCKVCGHSLTGYDRYLLGDTNICVECQDDIEKGNLDTNKADIILLTNEVYI